MPPQQRRPGLTDGQIGEKLGIDEQVVREIRCVAERDKYSIDEFEAAIRFKDESCRNYARKGLSSVTGKYVGK